MKEKQIDLKYKNEEVKCLVELPEVILGEKEIGDVQTLNLEYMSKVADEQSVLAPFFRVYGSYLNHETKKEIEEELNIRNEEKKYQLEELKVLKDVLEEQDIDFVLIKGFALSAIIYEDMFQRDFGDCDIIVDYKDFMKVNRIMRDLGYLSSLNLEDAASILPLDCYEIKYIKSFSEEIEMYVEIKLGTSSIKDIAIIRKFAKNAIDISIDGNMYPSFSLNDTFILLCTNTYCNFELEFAVARLRDLYDIKLFYEKYKNKIELAYIIRFSIENKQMHQIGAIMNLINYYYKNTFKKEIVEMFSLSNIPYEKQVFHEYSHLWLRDWLIEPIDVMLNRDVHCTEMFFQQSYKAYGSRNLNYNNKIFIPKSNNGIIDEKLLLGIESKEYSVKQMYQVSHNDSSIIFRIIFESFDEKIDIKTSLMLFDIDRCEPRKIVNFNLRNGKWCSNSTTENFRYKELKNDRNEIVIKVDKKNFRVLDAGGKCLCIYMYGVVNFHNIVDFALKNENSDMSYENPIMFYFAD